MSSSSVSADLFSSCSVHLLTTVSETIMGVARVL